MGAYRHDTKLMHHGRKPDRRALKPTTECPQGMCLDAGYDYDVVYAILKEFGITRPCANARRGGESHEMGCGRARAELGPAAGAFVDEPFSLEARFGFDKKSEDAPRVSAFFLWLDGLSGRRVIRIGC